MDYDLTRLGNREFEHLTQALALKVLGPGVSVFGDGPDGGREATHTGRVRWAPDDRVSDWDGYVVIQAKFRNRPLGTTPDTRWFRATLKAELKRWADQESRRRKKGRLPQYLLLSTNIVLSGAEDGGVDAVDRLVGGYAQRLGLRGWHTWHYDKICRLLDGHADIRKAFSGLITPGDVLMLLADVLQGQASDLGEILTSHAIKEMLAEQWVRLGQAGHANNEKLALGRIAIDLPALRPHPEKLAVVNAAQYLLGRGDSVLRPSLIGQKHPHVVLVGGPGQGKTTLGQLVAQIYRIALLGETDRLGAEADNLLTTLRGSLADINLPVPNSRRWPVRVELATYADVVAGGSDVSLLRWIADRVSARATDRVTAGQLRGWLASWPWLLVLDGLDEVASPHAREHLMRHISDFLVDAARVDADLLIVATTRPQGYTGEFTDRLYEHLILAPLMPQAAIAYATRLADARYGDDIDLRDRVLRRVKRAADEPLTARLMRTPLQVTIMSLLLEQRARVPQDRSRLFDAYYETIYAREAAKRGPLARLLDEYRADVHALHERVGLELQVLAEADGEADASMPAERLRALAIARLMAEGHHEPDIHWLADDLVKAATHRLVLLIPKADHNIGFEVRSLQEFMAARAIVSGTDDIIIERLRLLAPSAHWRNTWLLAAGRTFIFREYLRTRAVSLLREIEAEDLLAIVIGAGAELAADMLDDDIAARTPQYRTLLAQHALELLQHPPNESLRQRALTLAGIATDPRLRALVIRALERAAVGSTVQRATAYVLLHTLQQRSDTLAAKARQLRATIQLDPVQALSLSTLTGSQRPANETEPQPHRGTAKSLGWFLRPHLHDNDLEPADKHALEKLLAELDHTKVSTVAGKPRTAVLPVRFTAADPEVLEQALTRPKVADTVAVAVSRIRLQDWAATGAVRHILAAWHQRRPIGPSLLEVTSAEPDT
ncbi:hypothetical protein FDG2_3328 [Candidatus Protofrankia californiensis]|uniref:NACHT domain-containing protein n=1 Tax=Candidatus Protofrankia californiensis TaxID=1839754 RepID=A0A1C3NZI9_9ACTN|nr:hypothetical protein FDG2_3328 [Candidatus Protofrankia californiensis]